jgi:2-aminoadipate transaminase
MVPRVAAGYPGVVLSGDANSRQLLRGDASAAPDLNLTQGAVQSLQTGRGRRRGPCSGGGSGHCAGRTTMTRPPARWLRRPGTARPVHPTLGDSTPSPESVMTSPLSRRAAGMKRSDVRDLLHHAGEPDMISLAGGLPAATLFDLDGIRAATAAALEDAPAACLQYGMTEGQPALRAALAAHLAARGITVGAAGLVVTAGSQQGLDLVARALLDEGDLAVVERPSYLAAPQALGLNAPRIASIAVDADGGCVDALDALPETPRPRLVYVVTNFANPSGASMSLARRRQLVQWAAWRRVVVLEDDPCGELRMHGDALPSLVSLAREVPGAAHWCGYASSLSKVVAPGLRVGWLVLPPWLQDAVVRLKQAADLQTASFTQEVVARYLASGRLAEGVRGWPKPIGRSGPARRSRRTVSPRSPACADRRAACRSVAHRAPAARSRAGHRSCRAPRKGGARTRPGRRQGRWSAVRRYTAQRRGSGRPCSDRQRRSRAYEESRRP